LQSIEAQALPAAGASRTAAAFTLYISIIVTIYNVKPAVPAASGCARAHQQCATKV
jgi:hypothetical protein